MSGSRSRRCASVPNLSIGLQDSVCTLTPERDAGPARRQLLDHLEVDLVGLPAAADVLAEGQAEQAGVPERPEGLAREPLLALVRGGVRRQLGVGQLAGEREEVVGLAGGQFAVDRHGSPSVEKQY